MTLSDHPFLYEKAFVLGGVKGATFSKNFGSKARMPFQFSFTRKWVCIVQVPDENGVEREGRDGREMSKGGVCGFV